jgi:23S rRNA pseudouridine2457 synthase
LHGLEEISQKIDVRELKHTYILFNKPFGVLSQFTDKEGRKALKDYIPIPNVYPVGRLDYDSEGLMFLTDDRSLVDKFLNPRSKLSKTYLVQVEGIPTKDQISLLSKGVIIEGKKTLPAKVDLLDPSPDIWERPKPVRFRKSIPTSWLKLSIVEGRNRQVRKMTAKVGLPCLRLVRISIGNLKLGNLKPGEYRIIQKPRIN